MDKLNKKTPVTDQDDAILDATLRPQKLVEFIGQNKIKNSLGIFLQAAKARHEAIDHILIHGGPGLGKTTLANIIAKEMGVNIKSIAGPAIEKTGDVAALLTNLEEGDVLFIDEIHRLPKVVEEILYPAMEEYFLDIVLGKGPSAQTLKLDLPKFTLVGATTRASLLSSPLRDRFGIVYHLDFYQEPEVQDIIKRSAKIFNVDLDVPAAEEIARRSRRTPRIANRLLKRVRDYAQVKADGKINHDLARRALAMMEIDEYGLDEVDRQILQTLIEKFQGGPVGLKTLATATHQDVETLETMYEPFLIQLGFLNRTSRGRLATGLAYQHLGYQQPAQLNL
ncbi:MAG: Holliday junction branch migration DNA helicase RuvB [Patescibacteria group bacterium]|jgi:Holliday junction DNA helicase RuvB|nr:Holliday junction branch migration DNA helicase RuvB [Patescibacteria group bacterium]